MAVKYSDATLVNDRLQNGLTSLSVAEIEEIIEQWEAYADVLFKIDSNFTFDSTKQYHRALRHFVTASTALSVLSSTPTSLVSLDYVHFTANVLRDEVTKTREILRDMDFNKLMKDA